MFGLKMLIFVKFIYRTDDLSFTPVFLLKKIKEFALKKSAL